MSEMAIETSELTEEQELAFNSLSTTEKAAIVMVFIIIKF